MGQKFNATLETRISKKGKPYNCLVIKLTDTIEKLVFLDNTEMELLRLTYGIVMPTISNTIDDSNSFPDLNI